MKKVIRILKKEHNSINPNIELGALINKVGKITIIGTIFMITCHITKLIIK